MSAPIRQRIVATEEVVPAVRSRLGALGWLGLTALAYVAFFTCAFVPTANGVIVTSVILAACEIVAQRRAPVLPWAAARVGLGGAARGLVRGLVLALFAARSGGNSITVVTTGVIAIVAGAAAAGAGAAQVVTYLRKPPIVARGLPLDLPVLPTAPPRRLMAPGGYAALVEVVAAVSLAVFIDRNFIAAVIGLAVAGVLGLIAPVAAAAYAIRLRRLDPRRLVTHAVEASLKRLRPELIVYLGSGREWKYQLEMWLRTFERIERRVVVVVRDREVLRALEPTTLPVVCIPTASEVMALDLPSLCATMYVGNSGNNIHLLRRPNVRSVFIGHGDSDKGASANPFSRVYDEIWVAGAAGRDRYLGAGINLSPETFVEVGRPQLGRLPRRPDAVPKLTVLYAPTWEGWGEDPNQSSLPQLGPTLIRSLLAHPDVRVMYRPHPRTGHVDPAMRRAHDEVVELLRAAGAAAPGDTPPPPGADGVPHGDLLDLVLAPPSAWSRDQHDAAVAAWTAAYWQANPGHRILTTPAPGLGDCFEMADVLISDISSVTSDFLAADRPYAVVNTTGVPDDELRLRAAVAAGGFVLGAELATLDDLLAAATDGPDPTAAARAKTREYLLGVSADDPMAAFRAQVDRLCGPGSSGLSDVVGPAH